MGYWARFSRYWHTLRYLRWEQLWGRVVFRFSRPRPDMAAAPEMRATTAPWQPPARRAPSLSAAREFRFLNQTGTLDTRGWDDPKVDKLWRYNQHYFDDLNAHEAAARHDWHQALIKDWVASNPPGQGSGWEPYPTSLRIVNLIKWALSGNTLPETVRQSLAVQARWLTRRLEHHLLGNHLFANAKALIFAGLWFDGKEADAWCAIGFGILAREVPAQILPDGGQFEVSTLYHALALEDMLDLLNLTRTFGAGLSPAQQRQQQDWAARIAGMQAWLQVMSHPDGKIAFFNDAAFAIAPETPELDAYGHRLGFPIQAKPDRQTWLADSGYGRFSTKDAVLLMDIAAIGPDYLPGHAHADTLSFELSLFDQRVIVNTGISVYGLGPERLRQRGTAAHSTVSVQGANSSEVWAGFRVARRARILWSKIWEDGGDLYAAGAHDGYRLRPGKPTHTRQWRLSEHMLLIEDDLSHTPESAEARFHLHPDIGVTLENPKGGVLKLADKRKVLWNVGQGSARLEVSSWHPEFGLSTPSTCIVVPLQGGKAHMKLIWS